MDIKSIAEMLHPLERSVIKVLREGIELKDIMSKTGLQEIEVMRALQWLENKGIIKTELETKEAIKLDSNGLNYLKNKLPERRFLECLTKEITLKEIKEKARLNDEELQVSLGILKRKAAIDIENGKVKLTENGKKLLSKEFLEESFLKKLPLESGKLSDQEKYAYNELKKRKEIIKTNVEKLRFVSLTQLHSALMKEKIETNNIGMLTPEIIKSGEWKNKKFRRYDIKINVPKSYGGRKQEYRKFLDGVRTKFMALGFEEMAGPIVESEFWNMDALYMPQSHSARDIHSAYYIKEPKKAELDLKIVNKVRDAHENGIAGSKGWGYKFDLEKTKTNILRTQGTACSARMLASNNLKIPGKYFAIARCFRPDVVDATHSADFNQIEGIVVGKSLNLKHLFGLLEMFAKEVAGATEIKIVPSYFPFTEPSCELHAKHPQMGWIELGGAGIFRPELVNMLTGKDTVVIAWGLGVDRLGMFKLGIKDIRQLFSHNIDVLRSMKSV